MKRVGVLALQGDYAAHRAAFGRLGVEAFEVKTLDDIDSAEALVLPGGESTVMGSLLLRFGLMDRLVERIGEGLPVFGTCAGLILLASRIDDRDQPGIRFLDVSVLRNAYGRQIASFRARVSTKIPGAESIEAVFHSGSENHLDRRWRQRSCRICRRSHSRSPRIDGRQHLPSRARGWRGHPPLVPVPLRRG